MNKMRRTVALFIAMLMLFSCVQGGVFTAMAVDDVPNEQSAVEEVSVAEEPSEPSEADEVGSEQPIESDEGSQEDVASEEPSESEITESTEVETSEPSTESNEEIAESSDVEEVPIVESTTVEETDATEATEETVEDETEPTDEESGDYQITSVYLVNDNGTSVEIPIYPSPKRMAISGTVTEDKDTNMYWGPTERRFEWYYTGHYSTYTSITGTRGHLLGTQRLYCIQPTKTQSTGGYNDEGTADWPWTFLAPDQQNCQDAIILAVKYGYPNMPIDSSLSAKVQVAATQALIWEFVMGYRSGVYPYGKTAGYNGYTCTSVERAFAAGSGVTAAQIESAIGTILWRMKHDKDLQRVPSFANGSTYDATYNSSSNTYTITLTDTNSYGSSSNPQYPLSYFAFTNSKATCTKSGNKLTISIPASSVSGGNVLTFSATSRLASVTVGFKVYRGVYNDGSYNEDKQYLIGVTTSKNSASFNVRIPTLTGSATIKKTSGTGDVNGYCFRIWCGATGSTIYGKTDSSGNLHLTNSSYTGDSGTTITGLVDGDYSIREVLSQKGEGLVRPTSVRITVKNSSGATTYDKTFGVNDMYVPDGSNDYAVRANGVTGLSGGGKMTITVNNSPLSEITLKKASDTESVANKIFCLAGRSGGASTSMKSLDIYDGNQNGYIFFKTDSNGNAYVADANYNKVSNGIYKLTGVLDGKFRILEKPGSMSTGASLKSIKLTLTPSIPGSKVSITYTNESGNSVTTSSTTGAVTATITNTSTLDGWTGADVTLGGLSAGANLSIEFNNATEPGWSELSKVTTDGSSKSGFCFKFVNNSASNFAASITSTWYGKTNTSGKMYVTNSSYSSTSTTYKFTGMYDGYYSITEDLVKSGKKGLCEPTKWTVKITDSAGAVTTKTFTKASNTLSSKPSTTSKTEGIYKDSSGNYTLYVNVVGLSGGGSMSITVENAPTSKKFTLKKTVNTSSAMTTCLNQLAGNSLYDLSMSGAEYEVYVNGVYTETIKFTSGNSTTHVATAVSQYSYNVGDRIGVKETKAPKGFKLDSTTYYFTISSTDSQNVFTVTDVPAFDPPWSLTKIDDGTRNPQGDSSFEGAVFKYEYFDSYYSNDIVPSSAVADRVWYFETNEIGRVYYMEKYRSSEYDLGQPLYVNENGDPRIPYGTIRITEVKNPLGYIVLSRPLYYVFKEGSSVGYWETGSAQLIGDLLEAEESVKEDGDYSKYYEYFGLIEEEDLFGSFTIQKKMTNSGTTLQGNMTNLKAEFNVINRSANSVKIGDFDEAEPGEVCFSFWTDQSGYYASEKIFPIGTYEIVEVTPPAGTTLNASWKDSFVVKEENKNSYPLSYECENSPVLAGFKLYKFDKDRLDTNKSNINYPQGGANFKGATFAVYNESHRPVYVGGVEYRPGEICYTFTIKGSSPVRPVNSYTSSNNLLPYGSYRIVETKSPTGYFLNEGWEARFDITDDDAGKIVNANSRLSSPLPEEIYRGGIQIKKLDTETGEAWQGDAEMSGAVFAVYNNSNQAVYTDRDGNGTMAWYNNGQICLYLTTGGDGVATSSTDALPYGSYYVVEVKPPVGYKLNADWKAYFNIRADGQIVTRLTDLGGKITYSGCEDEIIRGGFSVEKVDIDRAHTQDDGMFGMPQGSASLQATMSVFNCSNCPVRVNGVDYEDGSVCFTFTLNEDGSYTSASDLLPYGYYVIKEAEAPDGYKLNEKWSASFYITEDGKIVEANSYTSNIFDEEVIRGGVRVVKEDLETGETPQGEANFGGTTFAIINRSEQSVFTDIYGDNHWDWYDIGEICLYLSVEKDSNVVTSSTAALPYGYYEIVECDVGGGYLLNEEFDAFFEIKEDGKVVEEFYDAEGNLMEDNVVKNEVIRGGVYLEKYDSMMEGNYAGRKEHFEGITFSIYSENDNPVVVDGVTYNKGDAVLTIPLVLTEDPGTEEDDIWSAQTALDALPYGTYTIKENPSEEGGWLANEYYFLSEEGHKFSIVEDGKLVLVDNSGKLISFHNLPIGRIEVKKVDQQGNALPKCKFILEFSEDGSYWEPVVYSEKHLEGGCSSEGLVDGCLWTDNNGIAAFEGLDPTLQYRITELETVNGYTLMSAPAYTGVLERNDDSRFELKIVVINSGTFGFPPTGLNDLWYIPLFGTALFVLGLGALGCTVYYLKRKKKSTM